jgi:hypothetical protein
MKNVAEMRSDWLTRFRRAPHDFRFTFTHGTIALPGESIPGACQSQRKLALSRSIGFWMSLDPATALLCATKAGLSVRFATLAQIYFLKCQHTPSYICRAVCITGISLRARCIFFSVTLRWASVAMGISVDCAGAADAWAKPYWRSVFAGRWDGDTKTKTPASLPGFCIR